MNPSLDKEEPVHACRTIAHFSVKPDRNPDHLSDARRMLVGDLTWKLQNVDSAQRSEILSDSWYALVAREIRPPLPDSFFRRAAPIRWTEQAGVRPVDAVILTVIGCELRAVLHALSLPTGTPAETDIPGCPYWLGDLEGPSGRKMRIVVSMVGEPRNVPCALTVERMLRHFSPGLTAMVGIAAGPRGKVRLGDVAYAERIYDYEHARLELRRFLGIPSYFKRPRPLFIELPRRVKFALQRLNHSQAVELYSHLIQFVDADEILPTGAVDFVPQLHNCTVAAGEKLIADGSLPSMCRTADQRIRACDQEDSGFAQACVHKEVDWAVFRGICDFADPLKGGAWQFTSALAAASAAVTFLRTAWVSSQKDTLPPVEE